MFRQTRSFEDNNKQTRRSENMYRITNNSLSMGLLKTRKMHSRWTKGYFHYEEPGAVRMFPTGNSSQISS